ncbi:unnamed protein product, partial [Laminaria digitata]
PVGIAEGQKLLEVCCASVDVATRSLKDRHRARSAGHSTLSAEAPRALAALRCLPCLVDSFSRTGDARSNAIERPLGLIEDLLAACSAWDNDATV